LLRNAFPFCPQIIPFHFLKTSKVAFSKSPKVEISHTKSRLSIQNHAGRGSVPQKFALRHFRATWLAGKQQDSELWSILVDLWVFIVPILFLGLIHKNRPQIVQFTITSHGPSGILASGICGSGQSSFRVSKFLKLLRSED
jgi:hypothetical protein